MSGFHDAGGMNGLAWPGCIAHSFGMRALLPILLVLAGCSSDRVIKTANGSAYQVDCGGLFDTKLSCNKRAQEMCPAGFNPLTSPPGTLVFTCSNRPVPATAPI
ncbi:MAG: YgdI/YgdR family lipoprotein [Pseudomonadota bacterium]|nr:YgdI/YgdR family lipoprotein [Pseudomonadota bacterium]